MTVERTARQGRARKILAAALSLWMAVAPTAQPVLRATAVAGIATLVTVEDAHAQRRSSGGYSRPSTRTPSFSPSSSYRRPSTSGGYSRPSTPVYIPRQAPAQSGADRAMQRRGAQDALDLFRGRSGGSSSGADRGGITVPQGPLVRERTPSTRSQPSYGYREAPAGAGGGWQPPAFAQGGRFGAWDAMLLWFLLDTLNRPGHARAFHDNQADPGVQAWRQEADRRAADDPALKAKLDELDRQTAALSTEPRQPGRLPADIARTDADSGGGFGGILVIVVLLAAAGFITWRFFRRRSQPASTTAASKGADMGPIDTARGMLRRKLDGKPYQPSYFRVGMTFPFDPTPFLMAAGQTKVTGPKATGGNNLVSVAAVGRIDAGDVEMQRLYLAGSDGWFQLWLGADGRPEECRWFQPIDEVHPADREEWGFWMDEREGMVGWPEFQTKDGVVYGRHWLPGDRRVEPREWTETIEDARGTTTRRVNAMLYSRPTGAAAPAPDAEYILVSVIEGGGEAYVEVAAGIDVNAASLTIA